MASADFVESKYPVFILFSPKTVAWLTDLVRQFVPERDAHSDPFLRVVRGPMNRETNRTIAVFSEGTYQRLKEAGYCEYNSENQVRVARFELRSNDFPEAGATASLFVPVPLAISGNEVQIEQYINHRLKRLVDWGLLPAESWSLTLPLRSRTHGGVKGGCTISFDSSVDPEAVALTRRVLTDSDWEGLGGGADLKFVCHWARDPNYYQTLSAEDNDKTVPAKESTPTPSQSDKDAKKRDKTQRLIRNATVSSDQKTRKKRPTRAAPSSPFEQPTLSE